ncbi:MAG: hydantoinase/oxoprolinase family protein, partial [bacterium]|nr:hydantoinase/oxoprolinase family protein [bacterium]
AILRIATANMYAEFLPMIARYGVDQRDFILLPYGGAGPTHAFFLAEEVGLTRLLIPRPPGAMCALGAALADFQMDFVRSIRSMLSDAESLEKVFGELEEEAASWLSAQEIPLAGAEFERSGDMRFHGQSFDLTVSLSGRESPETSFRRSYEQVYGYQDSNCPIEVLQLRLLARVPNPRPNVEANGQSPAGSRSAPAAERQIFYRGETIKVPVYRRADLPREVRLPGPAVVTQYDTTIFITPRFDFWTDFRGNIRAEAKR